MKESIQQAPLNKRMFTHVQLEVVVATSDQ